MRKRLRFLGLALLGLVIAGVSFGGGYSIGLRRVPQVKEGQIVLSYIPDERLRMFAPVINAYEVIKQTFYFEVPPDETLSEGMIEGMIEKLPGTGAEFTYYYNPIAARIERAMMEGKFAGIGVRVTTENGQTIVAMVNPGGPAEKAGIKPGDIIVAVDGQNIEGIPMEIRSSLLRGEPGSKVLVTVFRIGTGQLDLEVTRENIATPAVYTRLLGDGRIGYIILEIFSQNAPNEMREALRKLLESDKVEALILDLRSNPGGDRNVAITITSQFLPGGKPATQIYGYDGSHTTYATEPGGLALNIPLVVLIDQGSASASEMLAAALKDYGRAVLIGDTTRGKGVGQSFTFLPDGSLIMVVNHEFRSPKGIVIHGVGVQPDIRIPTSPAERQRGVDRALDKAIEVLLEQIQNR